VPPRKRKVNTRTFRKTIYAVVEGEQTERQYVEFVRSSLQGAHGLQILIENPSSDPKSLFRRAKDILREPDEDVEVWIICDVDDQGQTLKQLRQQRFRYSNRLHWAISNPEFAVWLIMHLERCTRSEDRSVFARRAKELGLTSGRSGKDVVVAALGGNLGVARRNAAAARKMHDGVAEFPDNNPSSEVDLFLEHVVRVHNDGLPVGQVGLSLDSLY